MSASEVAGESRNGLNALAAAAAVLLGLFLLAGASGHLVATWPAMSNGDLSTGQRVVLMLPGLILLTGAVVNLGLCWALWSGTRWALHTALACNLGVAVYCGWLLVRGVPEHPIGLFLAVVASDIVLLGAIRIGLVWPAARTG